VTTARVAFVLDSRVRSARSILRWAVPVVGHEKVRGGDMRDDRRMRGEGLLDEALARPCIGGQRIGAVRLSGPQRVLVESVAGDREPF